MNRRQGCTLSRLRSGHFHLLQDYKHRCSANQATSVQTLELHHKTLVRLQPTPYVLVTKGSMADPVGSIRAFSYLDNGNLD